MDAINDLWEVVSPRLADRLREGLSVSIIGSFSGANTSTVKAWLGDKRPALGERAIKLWHLLRAAGSPSPEFDAIEPFNQYVSELFGYSIIDIREVMQIVNVTSSQNALRNLRGQSVVRPAFTISDLRELYGNRLVQSKLDLLARLKNESAVRPEPKHEEPTVAFLDVVGGEFDASLSPLVGDRSVILAALLKAAMPLALELNSNETSSKERGRFRTIMGFNGVFDVSNVLNSLCSEQARSMSK